MGLGRAFHRNVLDSMALTNPGRRAQIHQRTGVIKGPAGRTGSRPEEASTTTRDTHMASWDTWFVTESHLRCQ